MNFLISCYNKFGRLYVSKATNDERKAGFAVETYLRDPKVKKIYINKEE